MLVDDYPPIMFEDETIRTTSRAESREYYDGLLNAPVVAQPAPRPGGVVVRGPRSQAELDEQQRAMEMYGA